VTESGKEWKRKEVGVWWDIILLVPGKHIDDPLGSQAVAVRPSGKVRLEARL